MVWQGPRLGFVAETGRFAAMETPCVRVLACFFRALLPTSSFFVFLSFPFFFRCVPVCLSSSCPFVCAAAICYSQQVRTSFYSTCSFCLCRLYPTPSRNSFVFCFFIVVVFCFCSSYFLGGVFFVVLFSCPVH